MYSPVFHKFEDRIQEVDHLRRLCKHFGRLHPRSRGDHRSHTNALTRACVVLLSGHLQAFVEDLIEQVIERIVADGVGREYLPKKFLYYFSQDAVKDLRSIDDHDKYVMRVIEFHDQYGDVWFSTGSFSRSPDIKVFTDGFGNPLFRNIKKIFGRIGYDDYERDLKRYFKGQILIYSNSVDQLVSRRNKISHGEILENINYNDISDIKRQIIEFAKATDKVVCSHFRKIGCRFFVASMARQRKIV